MKEDNRVKKVMITDKGKSVNADIKKEIDDFEQTLILGLSEEEINQFLNCINKIKNNLKEEEK